MAIRNAEATTKTMARATANPDAAQFVVLSSSVKRPWEKASDKGRFSTPQVFVVSPTGRIYAQHTRVRPESMSDVSDSLAKMMNVSAAAKPTGGNGGAVASNVKKDYIDFDVEDMDGNKFNVFKESAGKFIIFDFWATWCPPCRKIIPQLVAFYNKHKADGVMVYGITDDKRDKVKSYVASNNITYGQIYAESSSPIYRKLGSLSPEGSIAHIPTLIVIGPTGEKIHAEVGASENLTNELEDLLAKNKPGATGSAGSSDEIVGGKRTPEPGKTEKADTKNLDITVEKFDGKKVNLAKDYAGKFVVIDMWATWCPPCREAIPLLAEFYNENKSNGVVVVGIDCDKDDARKAEKYVEDKKIPYPCFMGDDEVKKKLGAMTPEGKITGIPTLIVIGPKGDILDVHVGFSPSLKSILERLLAANPVR
jgi:thiol-disulfide isomerase/thioredoxin